MTTETQKSSGMSKDLIVYVCLLALAGIQFVIAYQSITPGQMFTRMLVVAIIEASLALLFFMHLADNRGLLWFVAIFNVFVLLAMQYGWTDSFRISGGVPWAK
jgi:caa(3)-type oxidase subunit IV